MLWNKGGLWSIKYTPIIGWSMTTFTYLAPRVSGVSEAGRCLQGTRLNWRVVHYFIIMPVDCWVGGRGSKISDFRCANASASFTQGLCTYIRVHVASKYAWKRVPSSIIHQKKRRKKWANLVARGKQAPQTSWRAVCCYSFPRTKFHISYNLSIKSKKQTNIDNEFQKHSVTRPPRSRKHMCFRSNTIVEWTSLSCITESNPFIFC